LEIVPGVHALRVVGAKAHLIVEDQITLVDAGHRGSGRLVRRYLERIGRSPRDITRITVGGPMQPFKSGTGLIAVEGNVPVVPLKLKIRTMALVDRMGWPLRGDIEVVFGDPITFASGTDPIVATQRLEAAVAGL
jgi:1-acyl-sn-glycerol-3-phosphate acyltransferase